MQPITKSQWEAGSLPESPSNGAGDAAAGSGNKISPRKAAANRANAQRSTGPRTERGIEQVVNNLPGLSATRLLGLAEARTLKLEPGAAEALYRKLIAPDEPCPPPPWGRRRLYRDMDRELGPPPKDVFEKGLWSIEDSPAKFKMYCDALAVLKAQLERRDFEAMGPALRQLYGDALHPGY